MELNYRLKPLRSSPYLFPSISIPEPVAWLDHRGLCHHIIPRVNEYNVLTPDEFLS